jgi:hypothetical protein
MLDKILEPEKGGGETDNAATITHMKNIRDGKSGIFFLGYLMTPPQLHIFMPSNRSMTTNN